MIKRDELSSPDSCMSRALPNERTFVLLARDEIAPKAVREWCRLRVIHGKNIVPDPQIQEALQCADLMDAERDAVRAALTMHDDYVACMRWKHRHGNDNEAYLTICDSNEPGAFKVYRRNK